MIVLKSEANLLITGTSAIKAGTILPGTEL